MNSKLRKDINAMAVKCVCKRVHHHILYYEFKHGKHVIVISTYKTVIKMVTTVCISA